MFSSSGQTAFDNTLCWHLLHDSWPRRRK